MPPTTSFRRRHNGCVEAAPADLLIHGASGVVSWHEEAPEGADAVVLGGGKVLAVGHAAELRRSHAAAAEEDVQGRLLVPGFVDGHTHPVFAVGRAEEFDWRAQGVDYLEIARRGGGILSSVAALRAMPEEELQAVVRGHLARMRRHGTTTLEAKSGYGLDTEAELKSLRVLARAAESLGMTIAPTFLGAHMVPAEHRDDPPAYLALLLEEMLPAVVEQGLAQAADIFVEEGAFSLEMARPYLERAAELGLRLRVHADQFNALGAVELAVELGAASVDHLEELTDSGLEALAMGGSTFAGLLPAVPHFLRQESDAPARRILQAGIPYFVATDFNPGSCYTPSLAEAAHFARVRLRLTAEEALHGVTLGAAASLGLDERKGHLRPGADADLLALDLPDHFHFGYGFGENPVAAMWLGGEAVDLG